MVNIMQHWSAGNKTKKHLLRGDCLMLQDLALWFLNWFHTNACTAAWRWWLTTWSAECSPACEAGKCLHCRFSVEALQICNQSLLLKSNLVLVFIFVMMNSLIFKHVVTFICAVQFSLPVVWVPVSTYTHACWPNLARKHTREPFWFSYSRPLWKIK